MTVARWLRNMLALVVATLCTHAMADDVLKLAIGQRGNWENAAPELGQKAGIFRKHGLTLELLYTQGAGETLQAVISGSVDIGIGVGTAGVLGAFAKGAPVRAIANSMTGADDLFWYVPAESPVKSLKDAAGKTIAYSTNGSSTHLAVLGLHPRIQRGGEAGGHRQPGLDVHTGDDGPGRHRVVVPAVRRRGAAAGPHPRRRARVRSGRVSQPDRAPDDRQARALATQRRDAIERFLKAYHETLDWMYSNPEALKAYAAWVNIPEALARDVRDQFYPRENLRLDRLSGLEAAMADAVSMKFLPAPLTKDAAGRALQVLPARRALSDLSSGRLRESTAPTRAGAACR